MTKVNFYYSYVSLDDAALQIGATASQLIHAGAHDQIQICVNIYSRSVGHKSRRMEAPDFTDQYLLDSVHLEEVQAHQNWWNRCTNPMDAGIFEVKEDVLRVLEMSGSSECELDEGYKRDKNGWWDVEFELPIIIQRSDLVVMTEEIERIKGIGGLDKTLVDKPLGNRERDTLLKLVIGMAIKGYGYDSKALKSDQTKVIADDLASLGISMDTDTVRKYLKEAASTVLPAKPRKS
jgi:hypothetical protein